MKSEMYLGAREAAAFLGISVSKLNKARVSGDGPPFFRPPGVRRVLYKSEDLITWVEQGRRLSTFAKSVSAVAKSGSGRHG